MSRPSVTACALSFIIIGILMIFAGGYISYIYFTEITPPNYEAYYQRYVGSSFPRISGILLLMAGLTLFWGSSIYLAYAYYRDSSIPQRRRYYLDTTLFRPSTSMPMGEHPVGVKESYIG